jgi:hypothetical protein
LRLMLLIIVVIFLQSILDMLADLLEEIHVLNVSKILAVRCKKSDSRIQNVLMNDRQDKE